MHTSDIIGLTICATVSVGFVVYASREEKKSVRFSVTANQLLPNGQKISGDWKHGYSGRGLGPVLFGEALESGLSCALFDGTKKIIKKIPVVITEETPLKSLLPGVQKVQTQFSFMLDTTDMPKGPGYIRLRSRGLDLGSSMSVIFQ